MEFQQNLRHKSRKIKLKFYHKSVKKVILLFKVYEEMVETSNFLV